LFKLFGFGLTVNEPSVWKPIWTVWFIFPLMGSIYFSLFGYLIGLIVAGLNGRKKVSLANILEWNPGKTLELKISPPP
jgi:hypothetical protein